MSDSNVWYLAENLAYLMGGYYMVLMATLNIFRVILEMVTYILVITCAIKYLKKDD